MWATVQLEQAAGEYPMTMDGGEYGEEADGNWLSTSGNSFNHCYSAGNFGGAWLITVNCQGELIPATWATVDKNEGAIMGGNSETINLTLNTIGLEAGTYNANLLINTNDEELPHVEIPVVLNATNGSKETVNQLSSVYPIPATSRVILGGRDTNDGIVSDNALLTDGGLTIYGQSGGSGSLTAVSEYGSCIEATNLTINGGIVNATGTDRGIEAGNVTINGGIVNANEIFSPTVTLGWRGTNDSITVNSFAYSDTPTVSVKSGQAFYYQDGSETVIVSGTLDEAQIAAIGGNTLRPYFVSRTVAGYGNGDDKWVFISSPVLGNIAPDAVTNLQSDNYDLYRFNQSDANGNEWQNYKATTSSNHPDFTGLVNGQGYLYATKETKTLVFMGEFNTDNVKNVDLVYDNTSGLKGWNLVGNPFIVDAYVNRPFYRMNGTGSALSAQVEANSSVAAMEGVFVQASTNNETATFTPQQSTLKGGRNTVPMLNVNLARNRGEAIDNAIVRFDGGQTLGKYMFHKDGSKIYIPQDGEDYAIANAATSGEMPVNFKASEDGTYTLTVNVEGLELGYLHLIDNMTGADIDLLQSPSYTFTAKTTDYESRFKLVFATTNEDTDGNNDNFAFFSNGNIIVNGTGTLEIIDMLGRQLSSQEIHSTFHIQHSTFAPGVYVLRLIDEGKVRTQKIVVE